MSDKPKKSIKVKAFVQDLRSGMEDWMLIKKYLLNETMLPKLIDQLLAAGHLSQEDLAHRNMLDTTQKVADLFSFPFGSDGKD
jgi:hypothetical protein